MTYSTCRGGIIPRRRVAPVSSPKISPVPPVAAAASFCADDTSAMRCRLGMRGGVRRRGRRTTGGEGRTSATHSQSACRHAGMVLVSGDAGSSSGRAILARGYTEARETICTAGRTVQDVAHACAMPGARRCRRRRKPPKEARGTMHCDTVTRRPRHERGVVEVRCSSARSRRGAVLRRGRGLPVGIALADAAARHQCLSAASPRPRRRSRSRKWQVPSSAALRRCPVMTPSRPPYKVRRGRCGSI
ncbi:hypothetical protein B0H17DRAFT_352458 [Mycena rosella]|uniref:Uncharacterized protein n=1 Tax=Mycena rosella TaxID=1033263 RepID=A0AAD7CQA4_MYCRO|nr:hypothetical protein B0H17DRAFT_352458 [Mycena rosella]